MFIKSEIQKILNCKKFFPMRYSFKEYVKIVEIYMVNFNVTVFNELKIMINN